MKIKPSYFVYFILCILIMMNCEKSTEQGNELEFDCPKNQQFGLVELSPYSSEYFIYPDVDSIIFYDENESQMVFIKHNYKEQNIFFDISKQCQNGGYTNISYEKQFKHVRYVSTDTLIGFTIGIESVLKFIPEENPIPIFYDLLHVSMGAPATNNNGLTGSISLEFVTDERGFENLMDSLNLAQPIIEEKLTLIDKCFHNVYIVDHTGLNWGFGVKELNFNKEYGIVGFKDFDKKLWALKP